MTMSCDAVRERLAAFVDGELPVAEYGVVEQHVRSCVSCAAALEEQRVAIAVLMPLRDERAPSGLLQQVEAAAGAQCAPKPFPFWRASAGLLLGAGLFAGAALFVQQRAAQPRHKVAATTGVEAVNTAVQTLRSSNNPYRDIPEVALLAALSGELEKR